MNGKIDQTVYQYTLRNGGLFVHDGTIIEDDDHKYVYFKDKKIKARCPSEEEFGVICTKGSSLWLTERNDELAKRIFIEYELQCVVDLQKQIDRKLELIKALKN